MTEMEYMGNIIIALVKAGGGTIEISNESLEREPTESVFIERTENGYILTYKNQMTIDGAQDY